jgi:hypothetical protein
MITELPSDLVERVPSTHPLPVADAVAWLESSSSLHERPDRVVLIGDQAEELFTLCADSQQRDALARSLADLVLWAEGCLAAAGTYPVDIGWGGFDVSPDGRRPYDGDNNIVRTHDIDIAGLNAGSKQLLKEAEATAGKERPLE